MNKKRLGRTIFDKIMSWPAVRSYNFDIDGRSSISTNLRGIITIPLLLMIVLSLIYVLFPVIFIRNETISTKVVMS